MFRRPRNEMPTIRARAFALPVSTVSADVEHAWQVAAHDH
jgi:hypothetical protein